MKLTFITSCLLFISIITLNSNSYAQQWNLVWADEFSDSTLDVSAWTRETGGGGWGNNELEYYTNSTKNSFLQDGKLIIKAIKEDFGGRSYTSARLKTQNKKFWKYGKIVGRMKLPYGQGIWPAFWMLGQNITSVSWPKCGEIDIMEMIGGQSREKTVHGTVHWDNNNQHAQYGGSTSLSSGTFSDDFHTYTIEWDQSSIKWFVDGKQFHIISITPAELSEFHQNYFIILNLAVGGNWPGNPNASTVFPQTFEVDYVRVYQKIVTGVEDSEETVPMNYNLNQNYPNPFNPQTNITFSVPRNGFVSLSVYNLLGNKISTLINEERSAGSHTVHFDASAFSSGVYYYTLNADGFTATKKMILIK